MNLTISFDHEEGLSFTEQAQKSTRKNQYQDCEQKL